MSVAQPTAMNRNRIWTIQAVIAALVSIAAIVGLVVAGASPLIASRTFGALQTESYRYVLTQETTGTEGSVPGLGGAGLEMKGAYDASTRLSELVLSFSNPLIDVSCTFIGDGDDVFIRIHESRRADYGAKWLRTSAQNLLQAVGLGRAFGHLQRADEIYEDLEEDGEREIRGVATTRYSGSVDVASLLKGSGVQTAGAAKEMPVELFVDDDGFPRRISIEFRNAAGSQYGYKITQDYFDFGKSVEVEKPKDGDVRKASAATANIACFEKSFDSQLPAPGQIGQ
jgi:hypothetical protein